MTDRAFGGHIRSCRRVRCLTQEALAERSELATDTIRRLELGAFSPSLTTIRKVCAGLEIGLSTLFDGFELGEREVTSEIAKAVAGMSPDQREAVLRVLQAARSAVTGACDGDES